MVRAGQFHNTAHESATRAAQGPAPAAWTPGAGERVVPVVGCAGSCGATTVAVAIAEAANRPGRVVECSSATASDLVAASNTELGQHRSGWVQGIRGQLLLERASDTYVFPTHVPVPSTPDRPVAFTVLDVGWELGQLLAGACWLADQVRQANPVILVAAPTVPGLRRLEATLALLDGTPSIAAVVGPPRKRWPRAVQHGCGSRTRTLDRAGRLLVLPVDPRLTVAGLDPAPLPAPLLAAAADLLRLATQLGKEPGS